MKHRHTVRMACVLLSTAALAQAQSWPEKPIRLVVGFPPGGSGDFIAHNMGEEMHRLPDVPERLSLGDDVFRYGHEQGNQMLSLQRQAEMR